MSLDMLIDNAFEEIEFYFNKADFNQSDLKAMKDAFPKIVARLDEISTMERKVITPKIVEEFKSLHLRMFKMHRAAKMERNYESRGT